MSVVKTGVEIDTNSSFNNPISFEENGAVSSINATGLTAETGYYVRAYVVDDQGNRIDSENTETFTTATQPVQIDYFHIQNEYNGSNTITLHKYGTPTTGTTLEYSLDGNDWILCTYNTSGNCIISLLNQNDKVYFRSSDGFNRSASYYVFKSEYNIAAGGDLITLLDYTNLNTSLTDYCYHRMFQGCTSLVQAPSLPATTLASNCYKEMFYGCTSLTTAPSLPATTLASNCYQYMFQNCTSLTTAPTLSATTLAPNCYYGMFKNCTGLTTAPSLPATTLTSNCYQNMFQGCTSLTTSPSLPATTLTSNCYYEMFYGCTSLNKVITYAQNISATDCLYYWLRNVSALGDFYNLGGATYPSSFSGIPAGWTVHTSL